MTEALAAVRTLQDCESHIQQAIGGAVSTIGRELAYINTHRLFREAGFETLGAYTQSRWGWAKSRAYQIIEASEIVDGFSTTVENLPLRESHIRELAPVPDEARSLVWELAKATAPKTGVTAAHVRSLAAVVKTVIEADALDDGTGHMVSWATLSNERRAAILRANLDEETYERLLRQRAHVAYNTGDHEWYTPIAYIDAARTVLGAIDLDPASSDAANATIGAARYYTKDTDGRQHVWQGRVWLNPPYQQPLIGDFCDRLVTAFDAGTVTAAITLTNNATETAWFQALARRASGICFPQGRVKYWHPDHPEKAAPLQGQALCYLGDAPSVFERAFATFGVVR